MSYLQPEEYELLRLARILGGTSKVKGLLQVMKDNNISTDTLMSYLKSMQYKIPSQIERRIEELEKRLAVLDGKTSQIQPILPEKPSAPPPKEGVKGETHDEKFHTEGIDISVVKIYEQIKDAMLKLDPNIKVNPQKYYISLRKRRNFAFIKLKKKKMHIVVMLPFETGTKLIKEHKLTQKSEGVQKFYSGPCFQVTIENTMNLDEIINTLKEAYLKQE